ncbi:MAG: hypothetical protein A2Z25_13470 [Planctomycetes bacterium RBG_16_55_9]|nr:MAG: hypothetical protein A2Z25_13470 [Planctomycetes bacterium RBG_16_55_9]
MLDRGAEILGRDEEDVLGELAAVLCLLPLLFDADAGDDALRFCLACDVGAVNAIAPATLSSTNVCLSLRFFIYTPRSNSISSKR